MKIENYVFNKSSFLSVEKDLSLILDKIINNERLKKLLYYTTSDALHKPDLTQEQTISLVNKNIKNVPKLAVDSSVLTYIIVTFDNFVKNASNPEYRDNTVQFDIICHFDQWQLEDLQLRPYRIAAEIDSMLDKKKLTGIGEVEFLGGTQIILTDEFAGLSLIYQVIHGEEDKKDAVSPRVNEVLFGEK